eukprot:749691-Hanusia_phi.AAC.1
MSPFLAAPLDRNDVLQQHVVNPIAVAQPDQLAGQVAQRPHVPLPRLRLPASAGRPIHGTKEAEQKARNEAIPAQSQPPSPSRLSDIACLESLSLHCAIAVTVLLGRRSGAICPWRREDSEEACPRQGPSRSRPIVTRRASRPKPPPSDRHSAAEQARVASADGRRRRRRHPDRLGLGMVARKETVRSTQVGMSDGRMPGTTRARSLILSSPSLILSSPPSLMLSSPSLILSSPSLMLSSPSLMLSSPSQAHALIAVSHALIA